MLDFKTDTVSWIANRYIRFIRSVEFFLYGDVKLGQFKYLSLEFHQTNSTIANRYRSWYWSSDNSIFDFCKIPHRYFKIFTSQYEIFGLLTSPTNDKSSWPPFFCQLCVSFQIYYMYVQQSLPAHVYHFHPRSKLFAWIKFYMLSQVMFRFSATNPEHYLIKSMHLPMPENKKAQYLFCSSRLLAWLNRKNITKYFSALNK